MKWIIMPVCGRHPLCKCGRKYFFFFMVAALLVPGLVQGAGRQLDPASIVETSVVNVEELISRSMRERNAVQAVTWAEEAVYLADSLRHSKLKAMALLQSGTAWKNVGDHVRSEARLQDALELFQELGMEHERHKVYHALGETYRASGWLDIAMSTLLTARAFFDKTGAKEDLARTYNRLAATSYERLYWHPSYEKVDAILRKGGSTFQEELNRFPELADLYREVRLYLDRASAMGTELHLEELIISNKIIESGLYIQTHQSNLALDEFDKLIAYMHQTGMTRDLPLVLINKARVLGYSRLNQPEAAILVAEEALELARKEGIRMYEFMATDALYYDYLAMENYRKAHDYLSKAKNLYEEFQNERILLAAKAKEHEHQIHQSELELAYRRNQSQYLSITLVIIIGLFSVFFLILWRKNREKNQLLDELKEKSIIISGKNRELAEINAEKDRLFSILGHDLLNPFTSIIGFSQMLEEEAAKEDNPNLKEYASIIQAASLQVMQLLRNLLDWARMLQGSIIFTPQVFQLREVTGPAVSIYEEQARQKGIRIVHTVPEEVSLHADRNMIATVVRNLLSNAVKFTGDGGEVRITATEGDEQTTIIVEDTGIGISDENLKMLFASGGHSSTPGTAREKGTGLGLILCKDFIEKHRGTIQVSSKPGSGSTFTVVLPDA